MYKNFSLLLKNYCFAIANKNFYNFFFPNFAPLDEK